MEKVGFGRVRVYPNLNSRILVCRVLKKSWVRADVLGSSIPRLITKSQIYLYRDLNGLSTKPTDFCVSHKLSPSCNGVPNASSSDPSSSNKPNASSQDQNKTVANGSEVSAVETTVSLELSNERFGKAKDTCFKIMVGSFYDCIIPEDVESLWGPIPLQKLPQGVDNSCRAVTHG